MATVSTIKQILVSVIVTFTLLQCHTTSSSSSSPLHYMKFFPYNYVRGQLIRYSWGTDPHPQPPQHPYHRGYQVANTRTSYHDNRPKGITSDSVKMASEVGYHAKEILQVNQKKCYQCACAPEYVMYNMRRHVKTVHYPYAPVGQRQGRAYVTSYDKINDRVGGWAPCEGPIDETQAAQQGIATSECEGNCFYRIDSNQNIFRGCYQGEHEVDQNRLGCHPQGGSTYCFCDGNLCNGDAAPGH